MFAKRPREVSRPSGLSRAEWIGLAFFIAAGLIALPLVHDAVLIQRIWLTICSAVGISG